MKKLLALLALLIPQLTLAATVNLNASMSTSAIQSAINEGGNNSTINFAAGTYSITSEITLPCANVTVQGPSIPNFANPTAILNGVTIGTGGVIFTVPSGCNNLLIQSLWLENSGWIYFNSGNTTNITINNVKGTGLPDIRTSPDCCDGPNGIQFDGNISRTPGANNDPVDSNITLTNNTLGDSSSCPNSFATGEVNSSCTAVWMHPGTLTNFTYNNNLIFHVNEGLKFAQTTSGTTPANTPDNVFAGTCSIQFNYFQAIHRISIENQFDTTTTCFSDHNAVLVDGGAPYFGTLTLSYACCTYAGHWLGPLAHAPGYTINDLMMVSSTNIGAPYGIEYWGLNPQANNSNIEGFFSNGITWNCGVVSGGTCQIFNTYICIPTTPSPSTWWTGYITNEEGGSPPPTQSGNTLVQGCSAKTSTAPTISISSGNVTISNTGTNTSSWYTTDGSAPAPGGGNSTRYTGPFGVASGVTVRAVGMWGVPPQPNSWPSGYGYVPSGIVNATNTGGGGATLVSIALTGTNTLTVGDGTQQLTATGTYSDSSTGAVTPSTWASSASSIVSVSASGVISPVSAGTGSITASIGSVVSPGFTVTVSPSVATLQGTYLGTIPTNGVNTAIVGGTIQFQTIGYYSDGTANPVTPSTYSSSATGVCTITNAGLMTAVAAGSCNITSVTSGFTSSYWTVTVSAASVTLVSMSVTSSSSQIQVGSGTLSFTANGQYSNGTSSAVTPTTWISSNTGVCTINSAGVLTPVAAGNCNITAVLGSVTSTPFTVTVTAPPVANLVSLMITPQFSYASHSFPLALTGTFSDGSTEPITSGVTWVSSNTAAATIDSTGLLTPAGIGSTEVTAQVGNILAAPVGIVVPPPITYNNPGSWPSFCPIFQSLTPGTYRVVVSSTGAITITTM